MDSLSQRPGFSLEKIKNLVDQLTEPVDPTSLVSYVVAVETLMALEELVLGPFSRGLAILTGLEELVLSAVVFVADASGLGHNLFDEGHFGPEGVDLNGEGNTLIICLREPLKEL